MNDLTFEKIRDAMAKVRRADMHIAGTREQEALRKILHAAVNGAPLVVMPELEAGDVVLVDGKLLFHSELEIEAFARRVIEASHG